MLEITLGGRVSSPCLADAHCAVNQAMFTLRHDPYAGRFFFFCRRGQKSVEIATDAALGRDAAVSRYPTVSDGIRRHPTASKGIHRQQ